MIISAGKTGCSLAKLINGALKTDKSVILERGIYELDGTIYMPDDSSLVLRDGAILKAQDHAFDKAGCVSVITNSDKQNGNRNITISGGVFDGNNAFNHRENWKTGPCRGLLFDFINVDGLKLQNLTAKNSESYHFRLGFVCNFVIENVIFSDDLFTPCQDGIHVGGGCQNGVIRNIFAEKGSTNDDLVAFNADDVNYYCQNIGMRDADISDMLVENVTAEDCWTALRLLSVNHRIENVTVDGFTAGIREMGINCDACRYATDPLFSDENYPSGVGHLKNITLKNFTLWHTTEKNRPLAVLETNAENFIIENLKRKTELDRHPKAVTIRTRNMCETKLNLNGETLVLSQGEEFECDLQKIERISLN